MERLLPSFLKLSVRASRSRLRNLVEISELSILPERAALSTRPALLLALLVPRSMAALPRETSPLRLLTEVDPATIVRTFSRDLVNEASALSRDAIVESLVSSRPFTEPRSPAPRMRVLPRSLYTVP